MAIPKHLIEQTAKAWVEHYQGRAFDLEIAMAVLMQAAQATDQVVEQNQAILRQVAAIMKAPCPQCGYKQVT